jgi:UPF0716 family protein affecting phage T7 exclusion
LQNNPPFYQKRLGDNHLFFLFILLFFLVEYLLIIIFTALGLGLWLGLGEWSARVPYIFASTEDFNFAHTTRNRDQSAVSGRQLFLF